MTERPYTICHMLSAIDGKIAGEFFRMPELSPTSAAYGEIRAKLNCTATLCGAVTAAEIYGCGRKKPQHRHLQFFQERPMLLIRQHSILRLS